MIRMDGVGKDRRKKKIIKMYEESQLVETYIDTELSCWQCNRRGDKMKKEGRKLRKEDERRT